MFYPLLSEHFWDTQYENNFDLGKDEHSIHVCGPALDLRVPMQRRDQPLRG